MKLSMKPIFVGLLLMLVLSFPMGLATVQVHEYFLDIHGLSYEYSTLDQITDVLVKYEFHPYMLLLYVLSAIVTVSIPSFVVAYLAKNDQIFHGLVIGLLSVLLFFLLSDSESYDNNIKFIVLVSSLNLLLALLGAWMGKITKKGSHEKSEKSKIGSDTN
ncbi:MAG TPA: hypothetical protein EYP90_15065 [Chromatiaceae bacterium]|nr:hypothetical protein [Chromatiaceae bacterium]